MSTNANVITIHIVHMVGRCCLTLPADATFEQLLDKLSCIGINPVQIWKVKNTNMNAQFAVDTSPDALLSSFGVVDESEILIYHLLYNVNNLTPNQREQYIKKFTHKKKST